MRICERCIFSQVFWRENLIHLNRLTEWIKKIEHAYPKVHFFYARKYKCLKCPQRWFFFPASKKTRNDICLRFASIHSGSRRWVISRTRRILGKNVLHLLCLSILILSLARIVLEASQLFTTRSARKGE